MSEPGPRSPDVTWHPATMERQERWDILGLAGATVWLTGLSGSGKSSIAGAVEAALIASRRAAVCLDGDNLRYGLNGDLGFSADDRAENVRRAGEVSRLFAEAGFVALVPIISPFAAGRAHARAIHEAAGLRFIEVWVSTSLEVCEQRDPKGLYAKARRGELTGFTGIDDPYEAPAHPDLVIDGGAVALGDAVSAVVARINAPGDFSPLD